MVLPGNIVPPDAGWVAREIKELKDNLREGLASVARSFHSTTDALTQAQLTLAGQIGFLLGQQQTATSDDGVSLTPSVGSEAWASVDSATSAEVALRSPSTGRLRIDLSARIYIWARNAASLYLRVGYEILRADDATVILGPNATRSAYLHWGVGTGEVSATPAWIDVPDVPPDTDLIVRTRYGWKRNAFGATSDANGVVDRCRLTVTKLGM